MKNVVPDTHPGRVHVGIRAHVETGQRLVTLEFVQDARDPLHCAFTQEMLIVILQDMMRAAGEAWGEDWIDATVEQITRRPE